MAVAGRPGPGLPGPEEAGRSAELEWGLRHKKLGALKAGLVAARERPSARGSALHGPLHGSSTFEAALRQRRPDRWSLPPGALDLRPAGPPLGPRSRPDIDGVFVTLGRVPLIRTLADYAPAAQGAAGPGAHPGRTEAGAGEAAEAAGPGGAEWSAHRPLSVGRAEYGLLRGRRELSHALELDEYRMVDPASLYRRLPPPLLPRGAAAPAAGMQEQPLQAAAAGWGEASGAAVMRHIACQTVEEAGTQTTPRERAFQEKVMVGRAVAVTAGRATLGPGGDRRSSGPPSPPFQTAEAASSRVPRLDLRNLDPVGAPGRLVLRRAVASSGSLSPHSSDDAPAGEPAETREPAEPVVLASIDRVLADQAAADGEGAAEASELRLVSGGLIQAQDKARLLAAAAQPAEVIARRARRPKVAKASPAGQWDRPSPPSAPAGVGEGEPAAKIPKAAEPGRSPAARKAAGGAKAPAGVGRPAKAGKTRAEARAAAKPKAKAKAKATTPTKPAAAAHAPAVAKKETVSSKGKQQPTKKKKKKTAAWSPGPPAAEAASDSESDPGLDASGETLELSVSYREEREDAYGSREVATSGVDVRRRGGERAYEVRARAPDVSPAPRSRRLLLLDAAEEAEEAATAAAGHPGTAVGGAGHPLPGATPSRTDLSSPTASVTITRNRRDVPTPGPGPPRPGGRRPLVVPSPSKSPAKSALQAQLDQLEKVIDEQYYQLLSKGYLGEHSDAVATDLPVQQLVEGFAHPSERMSLEELERAIEEQHAKLVQQGVIAPDAA